MKKISRLATFLVPVVFLAAPLFVSAAGQTCTSDSDCNAGEYCTYVKYSGSTSGTCKLPADILPNETSSYVPIGGATNGGCPAGTVPSGLNCVTPSASGPSGINARYLQGYAASIINIVNGLVAPVMLAIAFIFFLWGVYKYFIFGATSDTERATGRQFILWSIIGFVVVFSIWGLVAAVGSTFGLSAGGSAPPYPTL